jgi:hypothetical protein
MVIYESKTLKIELNDAGVLKVEESGRKLTLDLKPLVKENANG